MASEGLWENVTVTERRVCVPVCQGGGGSEEVNGWNRSALKEPEHWPDYHVTLGICEGDTICCYLAGLGYQGGE